MDVLIYTEVENREMDAACLIKAELEKRGYTATIERYNRVCDSGNMLIYNPKVVVLPWLYDETFLFNFINNNRHGKTRFVNLQSEQILSENFIKNNYHMPKGRCKDEYHLSWGKVTTERFLNVGILSDHIWECGNINMDFNSETFCEVYKNKQQLSEQFGLNVGQKWCLFISSFTHPSMSKEEKTSYITRFPFLKDFVDISTKSQEMLCWWFEKFAVDHPEVEFIYRPHPVELRNNMVMELNQRISNFHVISDYSVRQWIKVCEKNTTWFSTSIADAYFQQKSCAILRPIAIPKSADCELFYDCSSISQYEEFEKYVMCNDAETVFPISKLQITAYYGEQKCGTSYKKFCDYIVDLLKKNGNADVIEYKCNALSRIRRNMISYIFQVNKKVSLSFMFTHTNTFLHDQLEEKHKSQRKCNVYINAMESILKKILTEE